MIDKGTFGGTPAAERLDEILNELKDERVTTRVARIINNFKPGLRHLQDIKDAGFRHSMLTLFYKRYLEKVEKNNFAAIIQSHLCNYLTALYRNELGDHNATGSDETD